MRLHRGDKTAIMTPSSVPVFILCGGLGTRIKEETEFRPKPMVPVGDKPIIWHIMRMYSHFGFRKFVLCMGYKSEVIRNYFLNFYSMNSDATVNLVDSSVAYHQINHDCDWEVTLAYTGEKTMTGARIAMAFDRYIGDAKTFAVTYGDGVTSADLAAELAFHQAHGKTGTVLGVNPPSRFGEFQMDGDRLLSFAEKPEITQAWINGGFFFFNRDFRNYLDTDPSLVLEQSPLSRLAADGGLHVYKHSGFWQCMDTQRDREHLTALWEQGKAPWVYQD